MFFSYIRKGWDNEYIVLKDERKQSVGVSNILFWQFSFTIDLLLHKISPKSMLSMSIGTGYWNKRYLMS